MPRCTPLVLAFLAFAAAGAVRGDDRPSLRDLQALEETLQDAIKEAEPSVACVLVSRGEVYRRLFRDGSAGDTPGQLGGFSLELRHPEVQRMLFQAMNGVNGREMAVDTLKRKYDLGYPNHVPESYGSGVVVDPAGLVLTNFHVVRGATKIYVRLPGGKGSYADVHAADPRSDLAVLRLLDDRLAPLKALKLGDGGRVRKGKMVLSLANPFAAGSRDGSTSASWGIISNVRRRSPGKPVREDEAGLNYYGTLLQTDARLNLGCSGGALIDLKGEMIGLTTSLAALGGTEAAGGFAVPLDADVRRIVEILKKGEEVEYGFLGIQLQFEAEQGGGVFIGGVSPNSPAQHAGLRAGESIVAVNDRPTPTVDDLLLAIGISLAGREVSLQVRSPARPVRTATTVLAKRSYDTAGVIASKRPPFAHGLRVDYTSVLARAGAATIPTGVYVREVQPGSDADTARLHNAVITHVNGREVNTPAEFYQEADRPGPVEVTLAGVDDKGNPRKVKLN